MGSRCPPYPPRCASSFPPSLLAGSSLATRMSWSWTWTTPSWWSWRRTTTGTGATTCGRGRGASSLPFTPTRSSAKPGTSSVGSAPSPAGASGGRHGVLGGAPGGCGGPGHRLPTPVPCRPEEEPVLGGAVQRAVPGLGGGAVPPGERHPLRGHAEGEAAGGAGSTTQPPPSMQGPCCAQETPSCCLPSLGLRVLRGHRPPGAFSRGWGWLCAGGPTGTTRPDAPSPRPQIATTRKLTVHLRPPASCDLEITLQGIKLILTVNEYGRDEEVRGRRGQGVPVRVPQPAGHPHPAGVFSCSLSAAATSSR